MAEAIDEITLKGLIAAEISSSVAYDKTELSGKRSDALEYYNGVIRDLPPEDGKSSVTSRDLSDTIGWILPGVIRVFSASDRFGVCEARGPEDEEPAKQATDMCNYIFWKENEGYRILYDGTHDSLLHGNGIGKIWWDETEEMVTSTHTGLSEMQLALLTEDDDVEVLAATENEEAGLMPVQDPFSGQEMPPIPIITYDVKIKRIKSSGKVSITITPPEKFFMNSEATNIANARFTADLDDDMTRSKLLEMGFDADKVEALPNDGTTAWLEEELARDEDSVDLKNLTDRSEETVQLFECYIKVDADGDGESELVRAYYAGAAGGGELLEWDVFDDEHPYFDIPCSPVPHRHDAHSIFDETADIMRIKTALNRQLLDNTYDTNMPQPEVEEGSIKNFDALTNPQVGEPIIKKKGSAPIVWKTVPSTANNSLTAIQYFDEVIEKRTGVSRSMMALDPETLTNQTATASQNQRDAAYSQVELIARNHAEFGWRVMFRKMLRLIVKHQDEPKMVRLREKWVPMDPKHWNADMDFTVNVGLGTGSRDRDMAMLSGVLQNQAMLGEHLAQVAPDKAIELLAKSVDTMKKIAESAGIKNVDSLYPSFGEEEVAQMQQQALQASQQPSPDEQKMQMEMQMNQQKLELEKQRAEIQAQVQRDKESAQMEADIQVENARLEAKKEIENHKAMIDMQIAQMNNESRERIEYAKLGMKENPEGGLVSREDERNGAFLQVLSEIGGMIQGLKESQDAAKRVVKDENGDVVGIEPVRPETLN